MKRLIVLGSVFALLAGTASAQDNTVKTAQKKSPIARQLDLTDQQQAKLKQVQEQRKQEMAALNQSNPMRQWQEKKKALNKKYKDQQKSVLTKEQQEKAKKLKKNKMVAQKGMPRKAAMRNRAITNQKMASRRQAVSAGRFAPQQNRRVVQKGRFAPAQRPGRSVQVGAVRPPSRMVRGTAAARPGRNIQAGRSVQAGRNVRAGKNNLSLQKAPMSTLQGKLNLTEAQKSTLTKSRDSYKAKADAIKKNDKLTKDQKKKELKALSGKRKEEMRSVLTKEQAEKMKTLKKRARKR